FAAERLGEVSAGDDGLASTIVDELRGAHAAYYLRLQAERAEALGASSRAAALDELIEDFDNIRAALAWASESFAPELLSPALPTLFTVYIEAGALGEITAVLEDLKAAAARRGVVNEPLG